MPPEGDLTIAANLGVEGFAQTMNDVTRFADAGSIVLSADAGNIVLESGGMLSVAAANQGGKAGSCSRSARLWEHSKMQAH
jgi:hypothetical protein